MHRLLIAPLPFLLLATLLASPASAQQKVYQWKDAQGRTQYSGTPPKSGAYSTRSLSGGPAAPAPAAKPGASESPQCVQARANLQILRSSDSVKMSGGGDGQPERTLTAEERAKQTRLAETILDANCGGAPKA